MIEFRHVSKDFHGKVVLSDISMEIPTGELTVLIGPSGCGKTTTLKMINRLLSPSSGEIWIDGKNIETLDKVQLRRRIGYVIQQGGLFPHMTIRENIEIIARLAKGDPQAISRKTDQLMEMVDLDPAEYLDRYPTELSGGQQQRIGVIRALANDPEVVLFDEPFSALDPVTRSSLQDELVSMHEKMGKTMVFVTHDMEEALDLADVIIFMDHGNIVQMAPPEEMLAHPASGQIQDFLGNFIDTHAQKELTAADFMRSGVSTVSARRGVNECVSKMQRRNVDTLIVVDDQDRYQGTVSIADIRLTGHVVKTIEPLIRCNTPTVHTGDSAKDCFDLLISSGAPYLIVLNEEEKVDGIITKTSMTSAMAEQLWG